jgi:hypothetical protein
MDFWTRKLKARLDEVKLVFEMIFYTGNENEAELIRSHQKWFLFKDHSASKYKLLLLFKMLSLYKNLLYILDIPYNMYKFVLARGQQGYMYMYIIQILIKINFNGLTFWWSYILNCIILK